jgi:hypothetical protein
VGSDGRGLLWDLVGGAWGSDGRGLLWDLMGGACCGIWWEGLGDLMGGACCGGACCVKWILTFVWWLGEWLAGSSSGRRDHLHL